MCRWFLSIFLLTAVSLVVSCFAQQQTNLPRVVIAGGLYASNFHLHFISYKTNSTDFEEFGIPYDFGGAQSRFYDERSFDEVAMETDGMELEPQFFYGPLSHYFYIKEKHQFHSKLLALFFNKPTFSIVSYKYKNIKTLQDLNGKLIGIFAIKWYFGLVQALQQIFSEQNITAKIVVYPPIYDKSQVHLLAYHYEVDATILEHNVALEYDIDNLPNGFYTHTSARDFNAIPLAPYLTKYSKLFCHCLFVNTQWAQQNPSISNEFIDKVLSVIIVQSLHYRDTQQRYFDAFGNLVLRYLPVHQFPAINGIGNITIDEIRESLFWYQQLQIGGPQNNSQFWNQIEIEKDLLFDNQQQHLQTAYQMVRNYSLAKFLPEPDFFGLSYNSSLLYRCDELGTFDIRYCVPSENVRPFLIFLILTTITHLLFLPFVVLNSILLCAFSKKQPTKSRFISPFVGNFVFFFYFLAIAVYCFCTIFRYVDPHFFAVTFRINPNIFSDTILEAFIFFVFITDCLFLLCMLQTIRYFYIRWIYTKMKFLISKPKLLKFNQLLISKWFFVLVYLILGAFVLLVFCPLYIIDNDDRDASDTNIIGLALSVCCGVVFLTIIFLSFIIDALCNAKKLIRCKWKWYFTQDDPYYFRLESICFVILVLFGLALLISVGVNPDMDSDMAQPIFASLLLTAYHGISLFLIGGGFIIVSQLFTFCSKKRKEKVVSSQRDVYNEQLENLLADSEGYQIMYHYSTREFSVENVFCYKQIMELLERCNNTEITVSELYSQMELIDSEYIGKNSALEVNLSSTARNSWESVMHQCSQHTKDDQSNILIDNIKMSLLELKKDVVRNLNDTYSRCSSTMDYKLFTKAQEEKQKILKQLNLEPTIIGTELEPISPRQLRKSMAE